MFAIEILLKGTALLGLAFALATALRGASAATRHIVWAVGLVGLLALPFLTAGMPWRLDVLPSSLASWIDGPAAADPAAEAAVDPSAPPTSFPLGSDPDAAELAGGPEPTAPVTVGPASDTAAATQAASSDAQPAAALRLILALWLAGTAIISARWIGGWVALHRCMRGARPLAGPEWEAPVREASDRLLLDTPIRLLVSERVPMPMTAGILRPVVLLPESAETWTRERRRAVLVHELAHIRRKDAVAHGLAWLVCALWWFHPMAWGAARRMRAESERACDDLVLRAGTRASSYADHLLDIVCHATTSRAPAPAMPLAQRSEFEGRMLRILSPNARRHGLSALTALGIAVAFAAVAVPLAAIAPAPPPGPADLVREALGDTGDRALDEAPSGAVRARNLEAAVDAAMESAMEKGRSDVGDALTAEEKAIADEKLGAGFSSSWTQSSAASQSAASAQAESASRLSAIVALVAALGDRDHEVRGAAAQALGELDDPRAVEALMRALRTDSDAGVRATAAWALGEIEDAAAVPALIEALGDENVQIRRTAAWALGEIEDPSAIPALVRALGDADPEVRSNAVWGIGEIQPDRAPGGLIDAAGDSSTDVRKHVAWALGEIEDPAGVTALRRLIHDSDADVRKNAVWALTEIHSPGAYEALVELLNDEDPEVRKAAAHALGEADEEHK